MQAIPPPPLPGKSQLDRIERAVTELAHRDAGHELAIGELKAVTADVKTYVEEQRAKTRTARGIATVTGSIAAGFLFDFVQQWLHAMWGG